MEMLFALLFIAVCFAAGAAHLRSCKRIADDLVKKIRFSGIEDEREGGDNWPEIEVLINGMAERKGLTYEDIEERDGVLRPIDDEIYVQE